MGTLVEGTLVGAGEQVGEGVRSMFPLPRSRDVRVDWGNLICSS